MKTILTTAIILALMTTGLQAQNLYVQPITGEQVAFELTSKPKLTFENRIMTVGVGQQETPFQLPAIRNLSFVKSEPNDPPSGLAMTVEDNGIRLFPNPVEDALTLEINIPSQGMTYRIFDMSGRQMATGLAQYPQTLIDMQAFRSGAYILTVEQGGAQVQSFRIVKN
jgi:hypothetical protein